MTRTALLLLSAAALSLHADTIIFDFNNLSSGNTNGTIQGKMNDFLASELGPGKTVTVTGAVADRTYNGDAHVVGASIPGVGFRSLTLGNSDGATIGGAPNVPRSTYDTFLRNVTTTGNDRIDMVFNFPIYAVSFDYEIFPDGTCPNLTYSSSCGGPTRPNLPDFTFLADGVQYFHEHGIAPGTGGTYLRSPALTSEKAPQQLGISGTITFEHPVTRLQFRDWPATIGIDNLAITTNTPEPASFALVGLGAVALLLLKRRRRS